MPRRGVLRRVAGLFRMDEEAWRRHANPWSVWTRFAALPALVLAVWSRAWIGWWALGPSAAVVLWLLLNPHVFPPAAPSRGWASRGIHGEALWFRHPDRVPPARRAALRWPALSGLAGFASLCWGLARLSPWPTVLGGTAVALAQLWRLHLLGRLYDEAARTAVPAGLTARVGARPGTVWAFPAFRGGGGREPRTEAGPLTMPNSSSENIASAAVSTPAAAAHPAGSALLLGALGVVFGDIGTSPIYAFRETLRAAGAENEAAGVAMAPPAAVFGVLSVIFWAVTLVVAVKYVVLVMRADNQGEGGTMSLLSLAVPAAPERLRFAVLLAGLAGASLFFGDAMITPAISVLSAVEGLGVATPVFEPYVVPIAAAVLVGLFAIQSRGSERVGRLFGPVMAAWFLMLALAGLARVLARPEVLAALDPRNAFSFLSHHPGHGALAVLGSAFLALTGGEALYADMGHFGRGAIRIDWFAAVMPALVLNYLGQAALVLDDPAAAANPFFGLFPGPLLYPAVILATAATVIASQAVISGAFALVQQAIQLGAVPRLGVRQTSEHAAGQVYVPQINWLLAAAVLALVFGFRSSEALANAYGIAVAGDMLATTLLMSVVGIGHWRLPWPLVAAVAAPFLLLDLCFVAGNVHKIPAGGWFPLLVGAAALTMMLIWRRGRAVLLARRDEGAPTLEAFLAGLDAPGAPARVPGTAVYLTGQRQVVPAALALNLRHNGVLHERVVLLHVLAERVPRIPERERAAVEMLPHGFRHVTLRFGFAEKPDVPCALRLHRDEVGFAPDEASYFLGNEVPVPSMRPELPPWQEQVFAFLTRNAVRAPDYFLIPPPRVVELGTRVEL